MQGALFVTFTRVPFHRKHSFAVLIYFCSQTSSILAQYALGPQNSFFTLETLAKWLYSHFAPLYSEKIAALAALNNLSATSALSSHSVLAVGTIRKLCESGPCDRRLVALAQKFGTGVRQLLEHNHRYSLLIHFVLKVFVTSLLSPQACRHSMATS